MHVTTDDALRRVDARWLGVPGFTFPWHAARYLAYAVGVPIGLLVNTLLGKLPMSGFWSVVYGLAITVVLTTAVMRRVDDERPVGSLPRLLWSEIGAPRSSHHDQTATTVWAPAQVRIFTTDPDGPALTLLLPAPQPDKPAPAPPPIRAERPAPAGRPTRKEPAHAAASA